MGARKFSGGKLKPFSFSLCDVHCFWEDKQAIELDGLKRFLDFKEEEEK